MRRIILCVCFLASVGALNSCGNSETDSTAQAKDANEEKIDSANDVDTIPEANNRMADMKPDADFAVAAADGGMLEVTLGKMAGEKGSSSDVKKLGAMMVKDHSQANEELKAAAKQKNITLPETLSDKYQKTVSDLQEKSGKDFDKAYADLMVSDHKDDIDAFTKESEKGNDPELSVWAKSKLPILEHHLMMAEETKKLVDKK